MPKKKITTQEPETSAPNDTLTQVIKHYDEARSELDDRIQNKTRGFDVYDRLVRNYIDKQKWPFGVRVPDGRGSTLISRKTDRLLANKLQGRMLPTKSGTELGARIATELIMHQWNQLDLVDDVTMLQRWRKMDIAARTYGAAFGLCSWKTIGDRFDGPVFEPWNNRDVLTQPGCKNIGDSEYVILRLYPHLSQLEQANYKAASGPIYDPDKLKQLRENSGPDSNYTSQNRMISGLSTTIDDRVELCMEWRQDRLIVFAPKQGKMKEGIILSDVKNPYAHGQIPIIRLSYYDIDDDIYGKPELEPVAPLIKTNWALLSQYLESAENELYTPIMVNPGAVQMHTLKFKPGARWLMPNPGKDVVPLSMPSSNTSKFQEAFGLISSLIMEGSGETGQEVSNFSQGFGDKTATEVNDLALLRSAKDNANKSQLGQAIGKMVYFWFKMDQQFLNDNQVIHVVGKEAMGYFINENLHGWTLNQEGLVAVKNFAEEQTLHQGRTVSYDEAYETMRVNGQLEPYIVPMFPAGPQMMGEPKLMVEQDGKSGFLNVGKKDLTGNYNFITDIEAMSMPNDQSQVMARQMFFESSLKVEQQLQQQGITIRWKEMLDKLADTARIKDANQFFSETPQQPPMQQGMQPGMPPQGMPPQGPPPGMPGPEGMPPQGMPPMPPQQQPPMPMAPQPMA